MVKLYARSLAVQPIESAQARQFLDENHRAKSGSTSLKTTSIALFDKDEIVGVAVFCYPRTSAKKRQYTCELLRLAFKADVRVIGGASKLVAYYKKHYKPADIFTYQDMTGEQTDVYKHCGFKLVSQDKKKKYLVAPGKTLETAVWGAKEIFTMAEAARRGPDALLGTTLGANTGKTNPQLFVALGWHIEATPGDRVWEWIDPNRTYYTYKVTASDSDKYYFGVSHVKKAKASVQDCLNDGYYGSGGANSGNKFINWKRKHKDFLVKEIISIHETKAKAFREEEKLISDLWEKDKNCLNSRKGGSAVYALSPKYSMKDCESHGETKHAGSTCCRCASGSYEYAICEKHGEVLHAGSACVKCRAEKAFSQQECLKHSVSIFRGSHCCRCANEELVRECEIHGFVSHWGNICTKCGTNVITEQYCETHGVTTFNNNVCRKCVASKVFTQAVCETHGLVSFRNGQCVTCFNQQNVNIKECAVHGLVAHIKNTCYFCLNQATVSVKECEIHGETKFQNNTCNKCAVAKQTSIKECEIHGLVKHRGAKCSTCTSLKTAHTRHHKNEKKDSCIYC